MRVFFALWPNDSIRRHLVALQQPIKAGRKLSAENLHLTLYYIGDVEDADCLLEKAGQVNFQSVEFSLSSYGIFRQARVLWAGPEQWPDQLTHLAAECRQVATACGYQPKGERFRPHVTLARKIKQLPDLPVFKIMNWSAGSFCLVESISTPGGVVYKKLGIFDSSS